MATHSGGLTERRGRRSGSRDLHRSFSEAGGVLNGLDLEIAPRRVRRADRAAAAAARARCCGRWPGSTATSRARQRAGARRRSRWSSRTPGCCRGGGSSTTSSSACAGRSAAERGRKALAEVGLAGREKAWPHELSGGEQQRAALARSLVREPELLLADEPFGALDALTRIRMHVLLRRLCEAHRPAVLLVTHDVDEAIVLADRVIVLDGGVIVSSDIRVEMPRQAVPGGPRVRRAARPPARRARGRGRPRDRHSPTAPTADGKVAS